MSSWLPRVASSLPSPVAPGLALPPGTRFLWLGSTHNHFGTTTSHLMVPESQSQAWRAGGSDQHPHNGLLSGAPHPLKSSRGCWKNPALWSLSGCQWGRVQLLESCPWFLIRQLPHWPWRFQCGDKKGVYIMGFLLLCGSISTERLEQGVAYGSTG